MPELITVAFEMGDKGSRVALSMRHGPAAMTLRCSSEYARVLADRLTTVADFMDGIEDDEADEPPADVSGESVLQQPGPVPQTPGH